MVSPAVAGQPAAGQPPRLGKQLNFKSFLDTDFKVEFAGITQSNEFEYAQQGGTVKSGLEYHVHYTNDKKEVLLSQDFHDSK